MFERTSKKDLLKIIGSLRKENGHLRVERTELAVKNTSLVTQYELERMRAEYAILALNTRTDESLFCMTFNFFESHAEPGQFYGMAYVCDHQANLQLTGRWGKPEPESSEFCTALSEPFINRILQKPYVNTYEIGKDPLLNEFPRRLPRFVGINVMTVPLIPQDGLLVGVLLLYKKGEQLFSAREKRIAEIFVQPAGLATSRID